MASHHIDGTGWTILQRMADWVEFTTPVKTQPRLMAVPEEFPCMVRPVVAKVGDHYALLEYSYVYKLEAELLALVQ